MRHIRTLLILLALQLLAMTAIAQTSDTTSEFGRASGGAIDVITKAPHQFSGSLSFSNSSGAFRGRRYDGSAGGALLNDRVWFFAAASVLPNVRFGTSDTNANAIDAKATAQPIDSTTLMAAFRRGDRPAFAGTDQTSSRSLPSSFLSLRSTTMLSDRMVFDISVSQRNTTTAP
jgi:hypothetical protein